MREPAADPCELARELRDCHGECLRDRPCPLLDDLYDDKDEEEDEDVERE